MTEKGEKEKNESKMVERVEKVTRRKKNKEK